MLRATTFESRHAIRSIASASRLGEATAAAWLRFPDTGTNPAARHLPFQPDKPGAGSNKWAETMPQCLDYRRKGKTDFTKGRYRPPHDDVTLYVAEAFGARNEYEERNKENREYDAGFMSAQTRAAHVGEANECRDSVVDLNSWRKMNGRGKSIVAHGPSCPRNPVAST